MPELPDLSLYVHAIKARVLHQPLRSVRIANPFLLRTVTPPLAAFTDRPLLDLGLLGKRLVFSFEGDLYLVLHLMIAGRLHWKERLEGDREGRPYVSSEGRPYVSSEGRLYVPSEGRPYVPSQGRPYVPKIPGKVGLGAFDFDGGSLLLTEAGSRRRASLHAVDGQEALLAMDPGGIDVLSASLEAFTRALSRERHTLKRALTDPRIFSGIGNAYSDEILHAARLSPLRQTHQLDGDEIARLYSTTRDVLRLWIDRLQQRAGDAFPEKVTAFVGGMAAHGRYGEPCPLCGTAIQRLVYAANEAHYCPTCQTGGRLLADRALSRLLGEDWPTSLEELEARKGKRNDENDGMTE